MIEFSARPYAVASLDEAKRIILTPQYGRDTAVRWDMETPYLAQLIGDKLRLSPHHIVLDFGCGIGRLAKALIALSGCRVVGIDQSAEMRGLAGKYVGYPFKFTVGGPDYFSQPGCPAFGAAIAVWVLQHVQNPQLEIDRIWNALTPGGRFLVIGEHHRCVPSLGEDNKLRWIDDGIVMHGLFEGWEQEQVGVLDPFVIGREHTASSYWAMYRKR